MVKFAFESNPNFERAVRNYGARRLDHSPSGATYEFPSYKNGRNFEQAALRCGEVRTVFGFYGFAKGRVTVYPEKPCGVVVRKKYDSDGLFIESAKGRKSAYQDRWAFGLDEEDRAWWFYNSINIGQGYKKRLVRVEDGEAERLHLTIS